jgi:hypothetical protein
VTKIDLGDRKAVNIGVVLQWMYERVLAGKFTQRAIDLKSRLRPLGVSSGLSELFRHHNLTQHPRARGKPVGRSDLAKCRLGPVVGPSIATVRYVALESEDVEARLSRRET